MVGVTAGGSVTDRLLNMEVGRELFTPPISLNRWSVGLAYPELDFCSLIEMENFCRRNSNNSP